MILRIPRLYDSHNHFLGTGQIRAGLSLFKLKDPHELANLEIKPAYLRGEWLVGFGWDENKWTRPQLPNKEILDRYFPDRPVFLSRADGHSSWLNSKALGILGMLNKTEAEFPNPMGGIIHRDAYGMPTGILADAAHMMVFEKLPGYRDSQLRDFMKTSCEIFNQAGFTHVRDMSCTAQQWKVMTEMELAGEFSVAIDANYTIENLAGLESTLRDCLEARAHETPLLRAKGLKLFYDGSLGSETAWLSQPYNGLQEGNRGLVTWPLEDIEVVMRACWEKGVELSVHTIGDQAVHDIVVLARKVSASGLVGRLNLEHVEVIRNETILLMKPLHVRCHIQPCHWLSDRVWLKEKLGELYKFAFPWEALRAAQIPFSFGSDSPIEAPSLFDNLIALEESAKEGIRALKADPLQYHSHPDKTFAPEAFTEIENGNIRRVSLTGS